MLQKLRTIIYHCEDLAAAKEWYTRVTGIQPYFDEPFYVGFNINGFELGLDPDMEGVQVVTIPLPTGRWLPPARRWIIF